jgi:hypothetical protein
MKILFLCVLISHVSAVDVDFGKKTTNIRPGSPAVTFAPGEMNLNADSQTTLTLYATADESITFSGNWEFDQGLKSGSKSSNWLPFVDISPLKLERHTKETYKIRCTTKPPYSLTISSVLTPIK